MKVVFFKHVYLEDPHVKQACLNAVLLFKHASSAIGTNQIRVNLNKLHFALACLYRNRQYNASGSESFYVFTRIFTYNPMI